MLLIHSLELCLTHVQIPDKLCEQCLEVLRTISYNEETFHPQHNDHCRLCLLLATKFPKSPTESPFKLKYLMIPRYGYFYEVHDIVFRPSDAATFGNNYLRLGLQPAKALGEPPSR